MQFDQSKLSEVFPKINGINQNSRIAKLHARHHQRIQPELSELQICTPGTISEITISEMTAAAFDCSRLPIINSQILNR